MAKKTQEMQSIIKRYKDETGKTSVDMHDIAKYAGENGLAASKAQDRNREIS